MASRAAVELFVSRLSFYTTTEQLRRLFTPFGVVTEVRLIKDPRTQRPKGFGFVRFESELDAKNALRSLNGRLDYHQILVARLRIASLKDWKSAAHFEYDSGWEIDFCGSCTDYKILNNKLSSTKVLFSDSGILYKETQMAELLAFSQSSLFLLPKYRLQSSTQGWNCNAHYLAPPSAAFSHLLGSRSILFPTVHMQKRQFSCGIRAGVVSDSKTPTIFAADSAVGNDVDLVPETGGGGDDFGGVDGNEGGGGGGSGGGGESNNSGDGGSSGEGKDHDGNKKKSAISMSQKLTLGYAVLVGAGGVIGYVKSGSHKSLVSGGLSAALLYYVYTLLPTKPVIASALGFGLSAALLGVMGSRFKNSGKIFPAGIVSLASLIMTGGYLHGIMRSAH